jgi:ABC-type uncharacterized transport system ATPase subunit
MSRAESTTHARAAVRHLLESPTLAERCRPLLAGDDIDWAALLDEAETMSGGERRLVNVAHELWAGHACVGLSELARGLDRASFERVVTALRLFRGDRPATDAAAAARLAA